MTFVMLRGIYLYGVIRVLGSISARTKNGLESSNGMRNSRDELLLLC
jgi:hypothetical protein